MGENEINLHLEELKAATNRWVEKKGDNLEDADKDFLRTVKLMVHGMEQTAKKEEAEKITQSPPQHDKKIDRMIDDRLEKFRYQLEIDLFYNLKDEARDWITEHVTDVVYDKEFLSRLLDEFQERVLELEDFFLTEQMKEVRDHVLADIKARKEAPETAQDLQTEWGIQTD